MANEFKIETTEQALILAIEALRFYASGFEGEADEEAAAIGFLLLRPTVPLLDDRGEVALRALAALRRYQADCIVADVIRELPWPIQKPTLVASK